MKHLSKKSYYLLAIIAFVIVNYLMRFTTLRLDLSKNHAYTLSDSSKRILRNLKSPVTITFYNSSVLPSRLQPTKRDVSDLLAEYKKEGRGKITVIAKDPKKDEKVKQEADQFGIPELNFSQQEQDQFAVTTGYFGIGIAENNKKAALPQVADSPDLEYNLTSAIYKITSKELPKVAVMGGNGQDQQFRTLFQASSVQFNLEAIATPDASVKAFLLIDNRTKKYSDEEIAGLEKYLKAGGRGIVFADGQWVSADLQTAAADHNLYGLLSKFGMTLNKNLVLSTAAEIVNFGGQDGAPIATAYPFWLRTQSFDKSANYFSNVRQLSFPWTSSVSIGSPSDIKLKALVQTTNNSWQQNDTFTLNPRDIAEPKRSDLHAFNLITEARLKNGGALMVIPASRFVEDQSLSRTSDNLELVLNVLSDYASRGALSGIRQRAVDMYPLPPDMSNQEKDLVKYLTILLLPALFSAYGVYRLVKRT
ncbi:GldG family protein [Candidatus Microgenomates bacterium]|nr:GldG family protein [Candidatus Microgenomates bacterium]